MMMSGSVPSECTEDEGGARGLEELAEAHTMTRPTKDQKEKTHSFEKYTSNHDKRGLKAGREHFYHQLRKVEAVDYRLSS